MSYQKIVIVGNLGRDPEMRYLSNGQAVTNLSVATNRTYTNSNNERVKETIWFRVTVWGRQAESCNQYLSAGRQVMVEGRLTPDRETNRPRIYQRDDGNWAAGDYEITAERVVFLSARDAQGGYEGGSAESMAEDDEIPF